MGETKILTAEKVKAVEMYMEGGVSLRNLARRYNVHHSSIEKWINVYRMFGAEGLKRPSNNTKYSDAVRKEAVASYLSGEYTLYEVCEKYKIRSISVLQHWLLRDRTQA